VDALGNDLAWGPSRLPAAQGPGIDGIVHRISTDEYARVQVKGRRLNALHKRIVVLVTEAELLDDRAVVLAVEIDKPGLALGPTALLVDVPTYRRMADHPKSRRRPFYVGRVHLPPRPGDTWAPWCLPLDELGERLLPLGEVVRETPPWVAPPPVWPIFQHLGYRGEMELLRRAADVTRLNMFKAFPDLEPNEFLAYDLESRGILGIQVKTVTLGSEGKGTVNVHMASLRPSKTTWFVIFAAAEPDSPFEESCAVVPSLAVAEHLSGGALHGELPVHRGAGGWLAPWRVPLAELGSRLAQVASSLA
jgi:hypothetical protein